MTKKEFAKISRKLNRYCKSTVVGIDRLAEMAAFAKHDKEGQKTKLLANLKKAQVNPAEFIEWREQVIWDDDGSKTKQRGKEDGEYLQKLRELLAK